MTVAVMALTTIQRVKQLGPKTNTDQDGIITNVINAYSQVFEKFLQRHTQAIARTETFDVQQDQNTLWLKGTPVISVASLKFSVLWQWDDVTAIDEALYYTKLEDGRLAMSFKPYIFGPDVAQVVYTGGMAADTASFMDAYPDIAEAMDTQCAHHMRRLSSPGSSSEQQLNQSRSYTGQLKLLDYVEDRLQPYQRVYIP